MDISAVKDIGAYIHPVHGDINVTGVAAGAGDNTEANGDWHAVPDQAQSLAVLIIWTATLAAAETFTLSANIQDATALAGTGAADFKTANSLAATVVATGPGGGGTVTGVTKIRYEDIRAHRGFMRCQVTGDLSAAGVDTFNYSVIMAYGGTFTLPATV